MKKEREAEAKRQADVAALEAERAALEEAEMEKQRKSKQSVRLRPYFVLPYGCSISIQCSCILFLALTHNQTPAHRQLLVLFVLSQHPPPLTCSHTRHTPCLGRRRRRRPKRRRRRTTRRSCVLPPVPSSRSYLDSLPPLCPSTALACSLPRPSLACLLSCPPLPLRHSLHRADWSSSLCRRS